MKEGGNAGIMEGWNAGMVGRLEWGKDGMVGRWEGWDVGMLGCWVQFTFDYFIRYSILLCVG